MPRNRTKKTYLLTPEEWERIHTKLRHSRIKGLRTLSESNLVQRRIILEKFIAVFQAEGSDWETPLADPRKLCVKEQYELIGMVLGEKRMELSQSVECQPAILEIRTRKGGQLD